MSNLIKSIKLMLTAVMFYIGVGLLLSLFLSIKTIVIILTGICLILNGFYYHIKISEGPIDETK